MNEIIFQEKDYEKLTVVSNEDLANAWIDERGVKYSADKKRLLKASENLEGEYSVLPETEVICESSFLCLGIDSHLKKVVLPQGLRVIGKYAFEGCGLEDIDIPDSVESIGEMAFQDCRSLKRVRMSNSVISINEQTFMNCSSLVEISLPSVRSFNRAAFAGCSSLAKVSFGKELNRNAMGNAFSGCSSLATYEVAEDHPDICTKDGIMYSKDMKELLHFPPASPIVSFDVPNSVTKILGGAFSYCKNLKQVNIPDSVTSIGRNAFCGCINLVQVNIPNTLTLIENFTFCGCSSLAQVTIPDSVRSIKEKAFMRCTTLRSIDIPQSVVRIGESAFNGCENLETINILGSPEIGSDAFSGCPGYKE